MIIKGNSRTTALVGGIFAFRRGGTDYVQERATVVFRNGIIQRIYRLNEQEENINEVKSDFGEDILVIRLDDNCLVFPGLIDLHNHIDYNMMPIWERPFKQPWDNRHEWRHKNCFEYNENIKNFHKYIFENGPKKFGADKDVFLLLQFFSELQAVSGGTTTLQEPSEISDATGTHDARHLLLRSTGVASDLGLDKQKKVNSIIDFFKPDLNPEGKYYPPMDTGNWKLTETINKETGQAYFREYLELLKKPAEEISKITGGYIVHLAEGRAGSLLKREGIDKYSKLEFEYLKQNIKKIPDYPQKVTASKLTLIHGCGIDLSDSDNIRFINECNIRIVWSLVSNLLLYNDTPDYLSTQIKKNLICIGSDWAPSGSKHVWDECSFAQKYAFKHIFKGHSPVNMYDQFLMMMTYSPAQALNSGMLGDIAEGKFADFYIISKNRKIPVQFMGIENIFRFSDYHSVGTFINGNLIFGVRELFAKCQQNGVSLAADGINSEHLMVHIPPELNISFEQDLKKLDSLFEEYSKTVGHNFTRSRFLSANDVPYRTRIEKLTEEYCQ